MSKSTRSVPQPAVQLWKLPPPHPLEKLPEVDSSREMTIEEYNKRCKNKKNLYDVRRDDTLIKKVVLSEIGKYPQMWSTQNKLEKPKYHAMVGVAVFKRTGKLLNDEQISEIFQSTKDEIRQRLRNLITKNVSDEEIEKKMWEWEMYGFCRFYRASLFTWEKHYRDQADPKARRAKRTRKEQRNEASPEEDQPNFEDFHVDMGEEEEEQVGGESRRAPIERRSSEDDVIFLDDEEVDCKPIIEARFPLKIEAPNREEGYRIVYDHPQHQPTVYRDTRRQVAKQKHHPFEKPVGYYEDFDTQGMDEEEIDERRMKQNPYYQHYAPDYVSFGPPPTSSSSGAAVPDSTATSSTAESGFEKEMAQISYQALRIAREKPDQVKILRKVLFNAVLAFDDKDYKNAEEVYKDLVNN